MTPKPYARLVLGVGSTERQVARPPLAPQVFVGVMAALAAACVVTGVLDVLVPAAQGEQPFGALNALVAAFGPAYLFFHVFVHNLGLACLVPGAGLVASKFEPTRKGRRLAAIILFGAVVVSLLVAIEFLVQASERFDYRVVLPLVALECAGVLALAWRGYRVVSVFHPTPRIGWSLVHPARELAPWFAASVVLLGVSALVETAFVAGFLG